MKDEKWKMQQMTCIKQEWELFLRVAPIPLITTEVLLSARLLLLWPAAPCLSIAQPWPSGYAFYNISFRLFFRLPCGNLPELSTIKTSPISHLRSLPGLAGESGLTAFLSSLLPPEAETSWCNTALWIHHLKNAGRLQRICWGSSNWQTRRSVRNASEFN